jgi:hypothetical protein
MGPTYRERMPNCHFVMVYDAGHAVATERPILAKTRLGSRCIHLMGVSPSSSRIMFAPRLVQASARMEATPGRFWREKRWRTRGCCP